ncbi:hypothetical protein [Lapidilactobacillus wuchangensis]|uniref:hypothetical protein n=1 Tax=Lapidilactobacillus wuchangensis TaxID=2486001 RepID=UPI000F7ADA98|nr:hypothetical protein [Lapidilactobacillus wuchangensis]
MIRRCFKWLMALLLLLITFNQLVPQQVGAKTNEQTVLFVYDSVNAKDHGDQKIQALQRTLTTQNQPTKTVAMADYKRGELNQYQAVITLVNWSQKTSVTGKYQKYWQDLAGFSGKKLHIGPNLQNFERQSFTGVWQQVTHQQYQLLDDHSQAKQLLPFTNECTLLQPTANQFTAGELINQAHQEQTYPYGVVQGEQAYLPFYQATGLMAIVATRLISQWLTATSQDIPPLLTITNVTPMSSFKELRELIDFLHRQDIPFAVSATSVQTNTELPEFRRYTKILRLIENSGGVIYLQVPYVYTSQPDQLPVLRSVMAAQLKALVKEAVYPVGISAPSFWNQDHVYQQAGLSHSKQVLLLSNPETISYQDYSATNQIFGQTLSSIPAKSLANIKRDGELDIAKLRFSIPMAITIATPTDQLTLKQAKKQIQHLTMPLANPALLNQTGRVNFGKHQITYHQDKYYLDGKYQNLTKQDVSLTEPVRQETTAGTLNNFFKFQDRALMIFLLLVLVILLSLMIVGRRIYRDKFRHKK